MFSTIAIVGLIYVIITSVSTIIKPRKKKKHKITYNKKQAA